MESSLFAKLCRECFLLAGGLTPPHVDLAFSKVAEKVSLEPAAAPCRTCICRHTVLLSPSFSLVPPPSHSPHTPQGRSIAFKQFMEALPLLATSRGCEEREIRALIASSSGPVRRGTIAQAVKLHDREAPRWGR